MNMVCGEFDTAVQIINWINVILRFILEEYTFSNCFYMKYYITKLC